MKAQTEPVVEPVLRCFSDIKAEPVVWLWPGYIPHRKLVSIFGDPGVAKSLLTCNLAAHVTQGTAFPNGASGEMHGGVLFLNAEDDAADTVRARLDAAGADVSLCYVLDAVRVHKNGASRDRGFDLAADIGVLERVLTDNSWIRLVVIDPISAYVGGVDSHSNSKVRGLLHPLAQLAARFDVTVIYVTHLRKSDGKALYRAIESIAFSAAARAVFTVVPHEDDADKLLFLPVKQNLSKKPDGLAYRIAVTTNGVPHIVWEPGVVDVPADDALNLQDPSARERCKEFLLQLLADGPVLSNKVSQEANRVGIASRTLWDASKGLGVVKRRVPGKLAWEWLLPGCEVANFPEIKAEDVESRVDGSSQGSSQIAEPRIAKLKKSGGAPLLPSRPRR